MPVTLRHSAIVLAALTGTLVTLLLPQRASADTPPLRSPRLCQQLGGPLPCQFARTTAWTYLADGVRYPDEAGAYAHMLERHDPASVFSLAYRWTQSPQHLWRTDHTRSIETGSWKIYRSCQSPSDESYCDAFPGYTGYHRVRRVVCPEGFAFSSDANSPYCLPVRMAEPGRGKSVL